MKVSFFEEVYEVVKQIPKGKVTTYGEISLRLRLGPAGSGINVSPQFVGWALHANKSKGVPCHRVVSKDGRLASGFAFGGEAEQRARLRSEGVSFIDDLYVDLSKHLFVFS
jgi:methylated-DNA-protein-cysteine methyltransferase-like protein